jgi:hypothetical protein
MAIAMNATVLIRRNDKRAARTPRVEHNREDSVNLAMTMSDTPSPAGRSHRVPNGSDHPNAMGNMNSAKFAV